MEPNFYFVCGINGCPHSFKLGSTFHSFKSHASRKHPNWQEFVNDEVTAAAPPPPLLSPLLDPDEADLSTVGGYSADEENTLCAIEAGAAAPVYSRETSTSRLCPPAQKAAALFLLTFQERFKLSQSAINFAVGSINTIVDSVCKSVQSSLEGEVSATRLTESFDEREDPFAPLKTEYMQSKFYREHFGLVVSCILENQLQLYCMTLCWRRV